MKFLRFIFPKCGLKDEYDLEKNRLLLKNFSEKIKFRWAFISFFAIIFQNLLIYNLDSIYHIISHFYVIFSQQNFLTSHDMIPYWINLKEMSRQSLNEYTNHFHEKIAQQSFILNDHFLYIKLYFSEIIFFIKEFLNFCYTHFKTIESFSFITSFVFGLTSLIFGGIAYIISLPEEKVHHIYHSISGDNHE